LLKLLFNGDQQDISRISNNSLMMMLTRKSLKDFLAYLPAIMGWYESQGAVPITRFTDFSTNNVDEIVGVHISEPGRSARAFAGKGKLANVVPFLRL